jgi:hypothetical protein
VLALSSLTEQFRSAVTLVTRIHEICGSITGWRAAILVDGNTYHTMNITIFFYLDYETTGTAATPGLLCQPRVIMKMIVESMMECKLAREPEVLGENLPQRHFCPSQNPTCPPGFKPGPPWWEAGD